MGLVLGFVRRYMSRYLAWYITGTVALAVTVWLTVTIPMYVKQAVDALEQGQGSGPVLHAAQMVAGIGLMVIGVRTASRLLFFTPGRLVEAQVKEDLFAAVMAQQRPFLNQWPVGDLVSRASSDVNSLRLLAGFGAMQIVNVTAVFVLTVGQMMRLSPALTIYLVVPLIAGLYITRLLITQLFEILRKLQIQQAELSDHVLSSFQGVAAIQGFVAEEAFQGLFEQHNQAILASTVRRATMRIFIGPMLTVAASFGVFALIYVGGPMAIAGQLSVGDLVAFIALVALLVGPLRGMGFMLAVFKQAQASLERVEAILAPVPDRPDLPSPEPAPTSPPALSIRGLSFSYPDGLGEEVLHDVHIEVPAGGTLGLLGRTGAGKSTLLDLISRLHNPPEGTVFIDGVDVRRIDLAAWRRVSTYVPQRAFLFSESVKDNVLMGAPDDGRFEQVVRLAALTKDLAALPQGADTGVGEAGLMLSGGQRQRSALARGLVREPVLALLDDVLSAVDHHTEQELLHALRERGAQPTTIIVAHRISAIQHATIIAVLDGGRVVDTGTHHELMSREGFYRDTWRAQTEDSP